MARHTPARLSEAIMATADKMVATWLITMDLFRPKTSESTPEGSSKRRLVRWKTPSASPTSARENPRAASRATQAAPAG